MPRHPGEFEYYVDSPVPCEIHQDFQGHYRAFRRLLELGYSPEFVVDAGASSGIWSFAISRLFPKARFVLVDPLAARFEGSAVPLIPICETVAMAVSDHGGRARFKVSTNLYGSSLIHIDDNTTMLEEVDVETTTLDALANGMGIQGRGIVKIDVQHAEHLVLAGGRSFITNQADIVVLELSLIRDSANSRTLSDMLAVMQDFDFRYFDDAGEWRSPINGLLEQKDILFVRNGLF